MLAMQEPDLKLAPVPATTAGRGTADAAGTLFRENRNVWRVAQADRAAMLVDAAAYFGALRQTLLQARRCIYIIGWDVDSRTPLMGAGGTVSDDLPRELGLFLSALVTRRPELQVKILLWDYSLFFSSEREAMPALALRWRTPPQIDLCLDDAIPLGSAHHQKIVIVDEQVAFCGGLDLTIRRWDNSDHDPDNPHRVDPTGRPYKPFHDVQLMVDGAAAEALTALARARWERAACESLPRIEAGVARTDAWPRNLRPDLHDVPIGIARTEPPYSAHAEVREVETLFHDMIGAARETIYIESQYVACTNFAAALAAALRRNPRLEAVIVCPRSYGGAFERTVMLAGRARVLRILRKAGVARRVLMVSPQVMSGQDMVDIQVHAKVMIVDDRYLRVGSANLCNRSMGSDTECDLVVSGEAGAAARAAILCQRNRLIAEHCGVTVAALEAAIERSGSLITAVKTLPRTRRFLQPASADTDGPAPSPALQAVADPTCPIDPTQFIGDGRAVGRTRRRMLLAGAGIVLVIGLLLALSLAWTMTPLAASTDLALWEDWLRAMPGAWAAVAIFALFVLAGLVMFPVTVMIAATAAIFGLWPGALYAGGGALASALATYGIGRWLGPKGLRQFLGPRLNVLSRSFAKGGIPGITLVRLVPVAPFSLVNLAAGALRIPALDYTLGTVLGLAPGVGLMSVLGHNLTELLRAPTLAGVATVASVIAGVVALSVAAQFLVARKRGSRRRGAGERAAAIAATKSTESSLHTR